MQEDCRDIDCRETCLGEWSHTRLTDDSSDPRDRLQVEALPGTNCDEKVFLLEVQRVHEFESDDLASHQHGAPAWPWHPILVW